MHFAKTDADGDGVLSADELAAAAASGEAEGINETSAAALLEALNGAYEEHEKHLRARLEKLRSGSGRRSTRRGATRPSTRRAPRR